MKKVRILALDETAYNHNIDNLHCCTIGAFCELILDPLLNKRLRELMGENYVGVDSDFLCLTKKDVVYYMSLFFGSSQKLNEDNYELLLNSLITALKELFKTDNVSLDVSNKDYLGAKWIFTNEEDMLWLIDKLNEMGIPTGSTLKIEEISN